MSLKTFTSLAGVPLHYDRYAAESGFGYGTRGKPFKPRATKEMIESLEACFSEIFAVGPNEMAEVITSAGAYVQKTGYHGTGEAFDLDGIFWQVTKFVALDYPKQPHLYLAIESIVRRHFGTVLAYNYNTAHRDHLHIDSGTKPGFDRMSKSRVEYLQSSLQYVHGYQVGIDGVWGPGTSKIAEHALSELGLAGALDSRDVWLEYLALTAEQGFRLADDSGAENPQMLRFSGIPKTTAVADSAAASVSAATSATTADTGNGFAEGPVNAQYVLLLHASKGDFQVVNYVCTPIAHNALAIDADQWGPDDFDADGTLERELIVSDPGNYKVIVSGLSISGGQLIVELKINGVVKFRRTIVAQGTKHVRLTLT